MLKYHRVITHKEKMLLGYFARLYYQQDEKYRFMKKIIDYVTHKGIEEKLTKEDLPDEFHYLHYVIRRISTTNQWL
ncbi:MAG: hypothetical protein LBH96_00025 [Candidatus Peribacteria bacterium]|jgi:hypothetical protein|nr:hypothetical protein [Candidatus Peribacteria bacterium]